MQVTVEATGELERRLTITLPGGDLAIRWQGEGAPVMMEGPTARVFDGQLRLPAEIHPRRRNRRATGRPAERRAGGSRP